MLFHARHLTDCLQITYQVRAFTAESHVPVANVFYLTMIFQARHHTDCLQTMCQQLWQNLVASDAFLKKLKCDRLI